jgi:hypothetical protein
MKSMDIVSRSLCLLQELQGAIVAAQPDNNSRSAPGRAVILIILLVMGAVSFGLGGLLPLNQHLTGRQPDCR